ncbi:MAG: ATP-binding cassette domain-containing protein [Hyphomicrobiaceae bacterium]
MMDAEQTAHGTGGPPSLLVRDVSHAFGDKKVLDGVSLTVPRGRFTILLGLNGAGKSTLFSLVTRLYDNVTGEIRIMGHDVRRSPSLALQRLGVVFQNRTLDSDLTLAQNLAYHAALHGIPSREARQRTRESLETVQLAERAGERVRNLSGGQARRVENARSLLHRPSLLLLDEPTVGLDIGSRESVIEIVRSLVTRTGMGVLWATHLIDEISASDAIVLLHKGRVLFAGSVPQMLAAAGGASDLRSAFRRLTGTGEEAMAA